MSPPYTGPLSEAAGQALDDPADFGCSWDDVEGRLRKRRTRRTAAWSSAAVAVLAVGLYVGWPDARPEVATNQPLRGPGGEMLVPGQMLASGNEVHMSDGSSLALSSSAQLAVEHNSENALRLRLKQGSVAFEVTPTRGPRRRHWTIHVGAVDIEVVGTQFVLDRSEQWLDVSVSRGHVRVTGKAVEGGRRDLRAGDAVRVPVVSASDLASEEVSPTSVVSAQPAEEASAPEAAAADGETPVTEAPGEAATVSDVLARVDALRRRGQPRLAATALQEALAAEAPGRTTALWAFTLGQLQLDALRQPQSAVRSFRRARRDGLPVALREQAAAREVEAWAAARDYGRAKEAAVAYLRTYPRGANRSLVLRWLEHADQN